MIKWIIASVVAVLALGAGVAYAATQLASETVTQVCVNDVNGMMRAASVCRDGEHAATIGGGGTVQATQEGAVTVGWGVTTAGKTLPLTGVHVAGKCELVTSPPAPPGTPDTGLGRLLVTTTGSMTAISAPSGIIGGTSLTTYPATTASGTGVNYSIGPATVVTSNGATATITFGAKVDAVERTCTYLWQAVEAPN
jgi:hypothetical protein